MLARKLAKNYTVEEYLTLEERSHVRHEFHDGILYAMAGGSANHSKISVNITTQLSLFLENSLSCNVYNSDMRIYIPSLLQKQSSKRFVYPDASISCSKKDAESSDRLQFPKIIIEVLSNSTELYERTTKFELYKNINTLEDYVLISQKEKKIEIFHRVPGKPDTWTVTTCKSGTIQILSIEFKCAIDKIYNKVLLPSLKTNQ